MHMKTEDVLLEWNRFDVLREMDFDKLCERRAIATKAKKAVEAELDKLNADIVTALQISEQKAVKYDKWRVTLVNGRGASKLSVSSLIELGVDPQIIADATEPGKEYVTVQMKEIKTNESAT